MNIDQSSLTVFSTGHGTVGTNAQPLVAKGHARKAYRGITVRSSPDNTAVLYVGPSTMSAGTGFILPPGAELGIPVEDPSSVYVVGASAGVNYSWISV